MDYSHYRTIIVEKANKVATITINRPDRLNAVGDGMHEELEDVFFDPEFSRDRFFRGAHEVLDAIAGFWDGLEADRRAGMGA